MQGGAESCQLCGEGTYKSAAGNLVCDGCPSGCSPEEVLAGDCSKMRMATLHPGAVGIELCVCRAGFYLAQGSGGANFSCRGCPSEGVTCTLPGITLGALPLSPEFWRMTNRSTEVLTIHYSLHTTHYSLLTTHYSLLTTHYSLLTTYYSPGNLRSVTYLLLTTEYSILNTQY